MRLNWVTPVSRASRLGDEDVDSTFLLDGGTDGAQRFSNFMVFMCLLVLVSDASVSQLARRPPQTGASAPIQITRHFPPPKMPAKNNLKKFPLKIDKGTHPKIEIL